MPNVLISASEFQNPQIYVPKVTEVPASEIGIWLVVIDSQGIDVLVLAAFGPTSTGVDSGQGKV